MLKHLQPLCIILLIGIVTIVSCSDNSTSVSDGPPPLPPEHSMQMDFSTFDSQNRAKYATTEEVSHFAQAVIRAIVLKTVVDFNLALPRALLSAAVQSDAQLTEGEDWEWTFNKSAKGEDYGVRLVASNDGEGTIHWSFNVTNSQLGLNDQLFFSGRSNLEGTEGTWFYYDLQNPESEEVSEITWAVNGGEDIALRFEVLSDRNDRIGDYIEYTFDGSFKTTVYYDASENTETELQWNTDTNAGYIIAPDYNDGQKACWDENLQDITCSG